MKPETKDSPSYRPVGTNHQNISPARTVGQKISGPSESKDLQFLRSENFQKFSINMVPWGAEQAQL